MVKAMSHIPHAWWSSANSIKPEQPASNSQSAQVLCCLLLISFWGLEMSHIPHAWWSSANSIKPEQPASNSQSAQGSMLFAAHQFLRVGNVPHTPCLVQQKVPFITLGGRCTGALYPGLSILQGTVHFLGVQNLGQLCHYSCSLKWRFMNGWKKLLSRILPSWQCSSAKFSILCKNSYNFILLDLLNKYCAKQQSLTNFF